MKTLLTLLLLWCIFTPVVSAQILYVKHDGNGNGYTWNDATNDLQYALSIAAPGTQIWVASGTYFPINCNTCSLEDRQISFNIPNGVQVYGGFAGHETAIEQRNFRQHPTQLSGDIGREDALDNSFTVVSFKNVDSSTILDGVFIQGGMANQESKPGCSTRSGGGVFNVNTRADAASTPTIRYCYFIENYAREGGAICNFSEVGVATATIEYCSFLNNRVTNAGGAIIDYNTSQSANSSLLKCRFVQNEARYGGAYFSNTASPDNQVFQACHFVNNQSEFGGAGFLLTGNYQEEWVIQHCSFKNNRASQGDTFYFQVGNKIPAALSKKDKNRKL